MTEPRKHHYCPQSYLAFLTEGGTNTSRIFVFDKSKFEVRPGKPKTVAHQRDFYKFESAKSGDPYALEKEFGKIEDGAKRAIDYIRIHKELPGQDDFDYLLNFIGLLAVRTPAHRKKVDNFHEQISKKVLSLYLAKKERWEHQVERLRRENPDFPKDVTYEGMKDFFDRDEFTIKQSQDWLIRLMLESASTIVDLLGNRNWTIICADKGSSFVTSDNPVGLCWIDRPRGTFSPGFGLPNTQLTIPLTRNIGLVGVFEDNLPKLGRLDKSGVARFNNAAISRSEGSVFSVSPDFIWLNDDGLISDKYDLERALKKTTM